MPWYSSTHASDKRRFNKGRFLKKDINQQELNVLYFEGKKDKELASYFNCSIPTIRRRIRIFIPDNLRRRKERTSQYNPINQKIINSAKKVNRNPKDIKLVVAGKYADIPTLKEAITSGVKIIGENKAQDLRDKYKIIGNKVMRLRHIKVIDIIAIWNLIYSFYIIE